MKKRIVLITTALMLTLTATACGSQPTQAPAEPQQQETQEQETEPVEQEKETEPEETEEPETTEPEPETDKANPGASMSDSIPLTVGKTTSGEVDRGTSVWYVFTTGDKESVYNVILENTTQGGGPNGLEIGGYVYDEYGDKPTNSSIGARDDGQIGKLKIRDLKPNTDYYIGLSLTDLVDVDGTFNITVKEVVE